MTGLLSQEPAFSSHDPPPARKGRHGNLETKTIDADSTRMQDRTLAGIPGIG
jgi:hypothetical protein